MAGAFLLCRDCRVVHRVYAAHELAEGGPVSEAAAIAYGQFLVDHRHHPLDRLEHCGTVDHHEGAFWDPSRTSFIEVSNGREAFTLRSARDSLEEAPRHEIIEGRLEPKPAEVSVDEALLRQAFDRHFYPSAVRPSKVDRFVETVRDILSHLPANELETEFDDADEPAVAIGRLPDEGCVALLERCMNLFDAWELTRVASFIGANRDEYGALALHVRRQVALVTHEPAPGGDTGNKGS